MGAPITEELLDNSKAFVYCITNTINGRKYFGKKRLFFTRSKPIKDSKRRKRVTKASDWEDYYGSSTELAKDIASLGKENFTREILRICATPAVSTYYELKFQMENDVLLHPALYYNNFCGGKIHRKHVLGKT